MEESRGGRKSMAGGARGDSSRAFSGLAVGMGMHGEVRLIYTRFFLPHLAIAALAGAGNNGRYLNPKFNVTDIRGARA